MVLCAMFNLAVIGGMLSLFPCFFIGTTPTCLRVAPLLASRFICLQQVDAVTSPIVGLPNAALHINTPLVIPRWVTALALHPNRVWVDYLIHGLTNGVRLGFNPVFLCRSSKSNMASTASHPEVVQRYLETEVDAGNVAGPFPSKPLTSNSDYGRIGVIPKPHKPGARRLIVDLSHPEGHSVMRVFPPLIQAWHTPPLRMLPG